MLTDIDKFYAMLSMLRYSQEFFMAKELSKRSPEESVDMRVELLKALRDAPFPMHAKIMKSEQYEAEFRDYLIEFASDFVEDVGRREDRFRAQEPPPSA